MAGEGRSWHVEVRQERDATDIGPYFDCWNVYLMQDGEEDVWVCRCLDAEWADRIMRALNHDLADERSGGDGG